MRKGAQNIAWCKSDPSNKSKETKELAFFPIKEACSYAKEISFAQNPAPQNCMIKFSLKHGMRSDWQR